MTLQKSHYWAFRNPHFCLDEISVLQLSRVKSLIRWVGVPPPPSLEFSETVRHKLVLSFNTISQLLLNLNFCFSFLLHPLNLSVDEALVFSASIHTSKKGM